VFPNVLIYKDITSNRLYCLLIVLDVHIRPGDASRGIRAIILKPKPGQVDIQMDLHNPQCLSLTPKESSNSPGSKGRN